MDAIKNFLEYPIGGGTVGDIGLAFVAVVAGFVAGRMVFRLLRKLEERVPERSVRRSTLKAIDEPVLWVFRGVGIWAALSLLPMPETSFDLHAFLNTVYQALTVGLATWLGVRAIEGPLGQALRRCRPGAR